MRELTYPVFGVGRDETTCVEALVQRLHDLNIALGELAGLTTGQQTGRLILSLHKTNGNQH